MTGIEVLIGAFLPVLLEFIAKYIKGSKGKFLVSLILPLLIGAGLNYQNLNVADAEAVLASGALIFASAQGVYKLYFRDSKLQARISS